MRSIKLEALIVGVLFIFLAFNIARADEPAPDAGWHPEASMNEKILTVAGDAARPVELQVTFYTPNGPGPFPLAVMNHGSSGEVKPNLQPRYHLTLSAYYFLSRGYAVAIPMMRGYAGSGGRMEYHHCDYGALGLSNALDIRAVVDYFVSQPNIDGSRVVVAGQSMGGWNTLAYGTLHDPRVKGLINFVGGYIASDCENTDSALALAAKAYGAHTSISSIWFYGDNDLLFSPQTWRGMYDSYTRAGGQAELVAFGSFMKNAHNLLGAREGLAIWTGKVDTFLGKVGLPGKLLYPEYLPVAFPPPSNFASIDDVDAVPYMNEPGVEIYRKFLKKPMPRVFVVASDGFAVSAQGSIDPLGSALHICQEHSQNCRPYAVDDHVVWTRPTATPPATHFAALQDVSAVPHLSDAGRGGYQRFLSNRKPRAFVIAPDGGWSSVSLGIDPVATALQSCSKRHQECQLYAVDNDVVWPEKTKK